MKEVNGSLEAKGLAVALVASRFNSFLVEQLVKGALDAFVRHGGNEKDLTLVRVPGAYELPVVAKTLAKDGVVTFEVKWYYYMSTRRTFMGTNSVDVDPNKADKDGLVKMVCSKTNPRPGWWEVQIRNKTTDQPVVFAKKSTFSILLK